MKQELQRGFASLFHILLTICLLCPKGQKSSPSMCCTAPLATAAWKEMQPKPTCPERRKCWEKAALELPVEMWQHSLSLWLKVFWLFCLKCLPSRSVEAPWGKETVCDKWFCQQPSFPSKVFWWKLLRNMHLWSYLPFICRSRCDWCDLFCPLMYHAIPIESNHGCE